MRGPQRLKARLNIDDAVDQLLKDHKMIRKALGEFEAGHPRFAARLETLRRIVLAHAWFEDEFLLPALKARPEVFRPFWQEISQEHTDIAQLLALLKGSEKSENHAHVLTLRGLLASHFSKEEDALFPLAQKVIAREGLMDMARQMERRKNEVRQFIEG